MTTPRFSQYDVAEIALDSGAASPSDNNLDVVFKGPSGRERCVPAFVSRGVRRVRYASAELGVHRYRAEDHSGEIEVVAGAADGTLRARGPLRVAADRRHLEHSDGTPFLWLADTWWFAFTERLPEDDFIDLARKRARQGFSVVQLVAGLYPETAPFEPEAKSASGWVWHEDLSGPNSKWFDEADRRIQILIEHDLVPLIVGSWGYYLRFMSVSQMLGHWREMIARWGAYPVLWCLAGEPSLIWYEDLASEAARSAPGAMSESVSRQRRQVNEVARSVRALEPFDRLITIHSAADVQPWEVLEDDSLIDFWFLQTGHQGPNSIEPALKAIHEALLREPRQPVINGEPSYEGIAGSSWQDVQRFLFWSHLLSGTAGHSYGAHGLWGFNTSEFRGFYSGFAPPWQEAAGLPGATQLGIGRRLLLALPWHRFDPRAEWVTPHHDAGDRLLPYAAGVDTGPRVMYFPGQAIVRDQLALVDIRLLDLGELSWRARLVSPRTGAAEREFVIEPDATGTARLCCGYRGLTALPSWEDWLLVLDPVQRR